MADPTSEFYLTLPSDSSMNIYPKNTVTHYLTELATNIDLKGTWEVGLSEITFPHSWHTIRRYNQLVWKVTVLGENGPRTNTFRLREGLYRSPEELIHEMNKTMNPTPEMIADIREHHPLAEHEVRFYFDSVSRLASIRFTARKVIPVTLWLNRNLVEFLGLKKKLADKDLFPDTYTGTRVVDLNQGFNALYVYCDLVKARHVGDTLSPLLRTVPISLRRSRDDATETQYFNPVNHLPLEKHHFKTIEIDIRDDSGHPVPFESGKVLVTLVFRRIAPPS